MGPGAGGWVLGLGAGCWDWVLELGAGCWSWGLGAGAGCPLGVFAQRGPAEDGGAWQGIQGMPKSYSGRGVELAVEVGIVLGLNAGLQGTGAEDPGASPSWWHQEAAACQGRAFTPPRRSHLVQANCCGARGQPGAPKSYSSPGASTRAPARCPPLSPAPSSSSLSLCTAAEEEERNPALQLLPRAAGTQEGEGAQPPAEQLKITEYFPNIIRFPCKQLP